VGWVIQLWKVSRMRRWSCSCAGPENKEDSANNPPSTDDTTADGEENEHDNNELKVGTEETSVMDREQETNDLDAKAMQWLAYLFIPVVLGICFQITLF